MDRSNLTKNRNSALAKIPAGVVAFEEQKKGAGRVTGAMRTSREMRSSERVKIVGWLGA
jgi:hypothetical protein